MHTGLRGLFFGGGQPSPDWGLTCVIFCCDHAAACIAAAECPQMEGIHKQTHARLKELNFLPVPGEHELITISSAGATPTRARQSVSQTLETCRRQRYIPPVLRLVKLCVLHPTLDKLTDAPSLNVSHDEVLQLWSLFDLDMTALHALTKGIQGFNQHRPFDWDTAKTSKALYFMASSFTYSVVWTYHVATRSTSGVVILRRADIARRDFQRFCESLEAQAGISQHPLCLFIALLMQTMDAMYRGTLHCQGQIANAEFVTGLSPFQDPDISPSSTADSPDRNSSAGDQNLDRITQASSTIRDVLVHLADDARQLSGLQSAVRSLLQAGFTNVPCYLSHTGAQGHQQAAEDVTCAIQSLRQQMDLWEIRIKYLRERAKNQLTVLFNLVARYDAASNISVALAAKRDRSSMKAIAVMTMLFLPSTFLAALFTVPSLPIQLQDGFWKY
ncbi:hypothetical protein B0T14DRAFT_554111 [Immersiella caudata]|uniref:Uncharacterized protein n=1 Tax=Immersiella caudata TaxID=314043 RepID=A0AA40C477_9PEZI|nr:hypothetical protein B0T14DRAFT_554111 [Immersiella caudata]